MLRRKELLRHRVLSALAAVLACAALAIPASSQAAESAPGGPELQTSDDYWGRFRGQNVSINVYNWGEYISDGGGGSLNVNQAFQDLTGIRVYYSTFATNEELYSKLRGGGASYDIVIPSDYMIGRMISEDMLEPLNLNNIPNSEYTGESFLEPLYDPEDRYSVPYTWGTVGIIYNTAMVYDEVNSWDILWDEKYMDQILMFSNPRDAFAIAQERLGYSLNTTDPDELADCLEALKEQKVLVQAYVMDEIFDKMLGGEAALAPYYAGDAITMMEENGDLAFAIPKEGTNIFVDAVCIPKGSKNKEAAEMYINFLCEPAVSAANSEYIGYSTPNTLALELLDEEITENPIAYPPVEVLEKTEYFGELPRETNLLMDEMWTELLSADVAYSQWMIPVALFVMVALSVAINIWHMTRRKRQRMLQRLGSPHSMEK